jgi:RNA polymerase sigma-70 factor (ECF subfamily)
MSASERRPGDESRPDDQRRPDDESRPDGEQRPEAIAPRPRDVSPSVSALSLAERAADAALVQGLSTGDEDAAVAFVRRFQSPVYGLALSITRDSGLAEDVSQEVFVRAWRAAATYDGRKGSVSTWLLTITRNAAIDAVRSRRTVSVTDDLLDTLLMGTMGPSDAEDRMLGRVEGARAAARLRTLPPEQARAVVLAVIGGCTAAEVSAREHIPLGTAKTRLRSGLAKLRTAMAAEATDA